MGGGEIRPAAALNCAVAALLSCGVVAVPPAAAHEGEVPQRARIIRSPGLPGIELTVMASVAPLLHVRNSTDAVLIVEGQAGEPFLRIGGGIVELNTNSPTSYAAMDPLGRGRAPAAARPEAGTVWHQTSEGDSWRWFDPRLRLDEGQEQRTWSIPMTSRGGTGTATGVTERLGLHGHLVASLDEVIPDTPDLEVRVLDGPIPALYVRNDSDSVLEVEGLSGEPFLRIGPEGVEANKRSPTWYLAGTQAMGDVPPGAHAAADPVFESVSGQPLWTWLEYRARVPEADEEYRLGERTKTVLSWTTPGLMNGRRVAIKGSVRWVPPEGSSNEDRGGVVWLALLGAAAGAAGLLVARRRRAGEPWFGGRSG